MDSTVALLLRSTRSTVQPTVVLTGARHEILDMVLVRLVLSVEVTCSQTHGVELILVPSYRNDGSRLARPEVRLTYD